MNHKKLIIFTTFISSLYMYSTNIDDWNKMFDYDPYFNRIPPGFENK